jgi:hypothetical protein
LSLHPVLLGELLDEELAVAAQRLGDRVAGIRRDGAVVRTPLTAPDGTRVWLSLDGTEFDADPFSVTVTDQDGSATVPNRWPASLLGGEHPVVRRLFVCVRGCAEYYSHPSHFQDRWDIVRPTLRLAELLDHLLRRAGRP